MHFGHLSKRAPRGGLEAFLELFRELPGRVAPVGCGSRNGAMCFPRPCNAVPLPPPQQATRAGQPCFFLFEKLSGRFLKHHSCKRICLAREPPCNTVPSASPACDSSSAPGWVMFRKCRDMSQRPAVSKTCLRRGRLLLCYVRKRAFGRG